MQILLNLVNLCLYFVRLILGYRGYVILLNSEQNSELKIADTLHSILQQSMTSILRDSGANGLKNEYTKSWKVVDKIKIV